MNKKVIGLFAVLLSFGSLISCGESPAPATIEHVTEESVRGHVEGLKTEGLSSGQKVTFTVIPEEHYKIDKVTLGGQKLEQVKKGEKKNSYVYSGTVKAGNNKLVVTYKIIPTDDIVSGFKLNCSSAVFDYIMQYKETNKTDNKPDDTKLEFRKNGIEQVRAACAYDSENVKYGRADDSDFFLNCVDGDTTHVETFNLKYTVKIRYLMIDTPESTSSVQKWGLSASYFSKYIYWGAFGKEDGRDAHYDEKVKAAMDTIEEFNAVQGGATSLILMSEAMGLALSSDPDSVTIEKIMSGEYESRTDDNGRDLAYVWYSTDPEKKQDSYRCLNLEMVYQGYSDAVGSPENRGLYFFKNFDAAQMSAVANGRHASSPDKEKKDIYYDDYEKPGFQPQAITLQELYESAEGQGNPKIAEKIGYDSVSPLVDKQTLYQIDGYISRMEDKAFYIQDKPSYDKAKVLSGEEKPRGLYVFTYANAYLERGMHVRVIGCLSSYGGTFQMQGISANFKNPKRDLQILDDEEIYKITPIPLTVSEFHSLMLPSVLVQITEDLHFYPFDSYYKDKVTGEEEISMINDGGGREVNTFSVDAYPYYNTSNAINVYAAYGASPDCEKINEDHRKDDIRTTDELIRIDISPESLIDYDAVSWRYFAGGTLIYNKNGAKYANLDPENPYVADSEEMSFTRKKAVCNDKGLGVIGISHGYLSTTRKTYKMSLSVLLKSDMANFLKDA